MPTTYVIILEDPIDDILLVDGEALGGPLEQEVVAAIQLAAPALAVVALLLENSSLTKAPKTPKKQ